MYHSIVIEESLDDKNVLKDLKILKTKIDGDWHLHIIEVADEDLDETLELIQSHLVKNRPYYFHFFNDGQNLIIVFQKKVFRMNPKDQKTWQDAQEYGDKILSIPIDQLDFYPTKLAMKKIG